MMPSTTNGPKCKEERPNDAVAEDDKGNDFTCCACMTRHHVALSEDSLVINDPVYRRQMCNSCVGVLTVRSPGGCWKIRTFGRPIVGKGKVRGEAEGSNPGAYNVDLGNGVRVSVLTEQQGSGGYRGFCGGGGSGSGGGGWGGWGGWGGNGGGGGGGCSSGRGNDGSEGSNGSSESILHIGGGGGNIMGGGGGESNTGYNSSTSSTSTIGSGGGNDSNDSSGGGSSNNSNTKSTSNTSNTGTTNATPEVLPLALPAAAKGKVAQPVTFHEEDIKESSSVQALTLMWSRKVAGEEELSGRRVNAVVAVAASADKGKVLPSAADGTRNTVKSRIEHWSRRSSMPETGLIAASTATGSAATTAAAVAERQGEAAGAIAVVEARLASPSFPPVVDEGGVSAPSREEVPTPRGVSSDSSARQVGGQDLVPTPIVDEACRDQGSDKGHNEVDAADSGNGSGDDSTSRYKRRLLHCGLGLVGVGLVGVAVWALSGRRSRS